jgi:hypothetical protein
MTKYTKAILINMTPAQKARLESLSEMLDISQQEICRQIIDGYYCSLIGEFNGNFIPSEFDRPKVR